jgi:hypothetical protein
MDKEQLQEQFWNEVGEEFGYDIIKSKSHPLRDAFQLYCDKKKEERFSQICQELEWYDAGDGVEYEVWIDPITNKLYKVEIEIVRNFLDMEEVSSLHEAKFGKNK